MEAQENTLQQVGGGFRVIADRQGSAKNKVTMTIIYFAKCIEIATLNLKD